MEARTAIEGKETLLTLFENNEGGCEFMQLLEQNFELIGTTNTDEFLAVARERFNNLAAVVIDVDLAKVNDCALLHHFNDETVLSALPVIVASSHELAGDDLSCLEAGAIDCISLPCSHAVMKQRITNAMRVKSSVTFEEVESILQELPSAIFLKDAEGRYVFCTHYWHHLDMDDDPNWTIRGKTDLDIRKDRENAVKAMEADREILRTGKGTSYVIEINVDGKQEFMELMKRPVFDASGKVSGIIALINDVTEHELMKRELERRANTDKLTGLGNRRSFDEYVQEIPQRIDFPIAIISADCDRLKYVNDTYGHQVGDEYLRMSALVFKTPLPEGAAAFRVGGDEFIAFLPGMTKEQADEVVATMQTRQEIFKLKEHEVSISYGTDVIESADSDILFALAEADRAMYANKAARKRARE